MLERLEPVAQRGVVDRDHLRLRAEHEAVESDLPVQRTGHAVDAQLAVQRLLAFGDDPLQRRLATEQPRADGDDDDDRRDERGDGPRDDARDAPGERALLRRRRVDVRRRLLIHQNETPSEKWMRVVPFCTPCATSRSSVPTGLRQRAPTP